MPWTVTRSEEELQEVRRLMAVHQSAWERAKVDAAACSCNVCEDYRKATARAEYHCRQVEMCMEILSKANRGVTKL